MVWSRRRTLLQAGLIASAGVLSAHGQTINGFTAAKPTIPNGDADLVLEQIWDHKPLEFTQIISVPGTKEVYVIVKGGEIRWLSTIDGDYTEYTQVMDLSAQVFAFQDHGMVSVAVHPQYSAGVTKIFVFYTGEIKDLKTEIPNLTTVSPIRPWGAGATGAYSWNDQCTNLGADNEDGQICEHVTFVDRIFVDPVTHKGTKELTLVEAGCGSSWNHGGGDLATVTSTGDIIFTTGDGASAYQLDFGDPKLDGCYDPVKGGIQGQFRPQIDGFANGRVLRIPAALLDSPTPITLDDLEEMAHGIRNPFRNFYHAGTDRLYIGDVGAGDGATTERIFILEDVSKPVAARVEENFGWPCLEGVRASPNGPYSFFDAWSEQTRLTYLTQQKSPLCDQIWASAVALGGIGAIVYPNKNFAPATAKPLPEFRPPSYEYRLQTLDSKYPQSCQGTGAAVTSVLLYEGTTLPAAYQGSLFFSDYGKSCTYHFPPGADGTPDLTKEPQLVATGMALISITLGSDGCMYGLDAFNQRMVRLRSKDAVCGSGSGVIIATDPPTAAPTPFVEPTDIPVVDATTALTPGGRCGINATTSEDLVWTPQTDGSFSTVLNFDAVTVQTSAGPFRTRAYNGAVPGPVMTMEACNVYRVTVNNMLTEFNDVANTDTAAGAPLNVEGDPIRTNLHVHGLHVSGDNPGDNVFVDILPGQSHTYTYRIPCDHDGGTYWYHPHHHGSVALQTGAGAAGLLIMKPSAKEVVDTPAAYVMPEKALMFQEINTNDTTSFAEIALDTVWETQLTSTFYLTNGCESYNVDVTAGEWTKLRMMRSGRSYSAVVDFNPPTGGLACDVALLAKDGVTLSALPRTLADRKMYFNMASRVDIAVRCPVAGAVHTLDLTPLNDFTAEGDTVYTLATVTVAAPISTTAVGDTSAPVAPVMAADLPAWIPSRPAYLMDLQTAPAAKFTTRPIEVRAALNGGVFTGPTDYAWEIESGMCEEWSITGDDMHPFHVHIHHMQLQAVTDANQWQQVPGWNVAGDWVDTVSVPGQATVRFCPERYVGPMVAHCHISVHSDMGLLIVMNVKGTGDGGYSSPLVTNVGTYPAGGFGTVPPTGVVLLPSGIVRGPAFKAATVATPTDVTNSKVDKTFAVTSLAAGSSMVYTFNVDIAGTYDVVYYMAGTVSAVAGTYPVGMSMYAGRVACPVPAGTAVLGGAAYIANLPQNGKVVGYKGTQVTLAVGQAQLVTLCFSAATNMPALKKICIGTGCLSAAVVDASAPAPARRNLSQWMGA